MKKIDIFDSESQETIAQYDIKEAKVYFTQDVYEIFEDKTPSNEELKNLADEIQINLEKSNLADLVFLEGEDLNNFSYVNHNNWDFKKL